MGHDTQVKCAFKVIVRNDCNEILIVVDNIVNKKWA